MPSLCNRCKVPGCCLNYLGKACKAAREEICPEVIPTRLDILCDMEFDDVVHTLALLTDHVEAQHCKGPMQREEIIKAWLKEEMQ